MNKLAENPACTSQGYALEDIEYNLVLQAINLRYGHDFGFYAQKSLKNSENAREAQL